MPKKKPVHGDPEVNEALKGFDIHINEFGEIVSTLQIEALNNFLNDNVEDKKLPPELPPVRRKKKLDEEEE